MQNKTTYPISLRDVPAQLLDKARWTEILDFAQQENRALELLNAPPPDGPFKDYWNSYPEGEVRRQRIQHTGRELSAEFRQCMRSGKFVAFGYAPNCATKARIPVDRNDLWPRFLTEKIVGRDIEFTNVTVVEAARMRNPRLINLYAAGDFIHEQMIMGEKLTKRFRHFVGQTFPSLKVKELDVLWSAVSGRKPGRPPENN
jgi:hypothetical protein